MKIVLVLIVVAIALGLWLPVVPFPVKQGWHGPNGEFCGIAYDPACDKVGVRFLTYREIREVIAAKAY